MTNKYTLINHLALREFTGKVFMELNVPPEEAVLAADVLAYSDEHGIDSHGIARLKTYFDLLKAGRINPKPKLKVIREKHAVASIDGDNGLGLVVGPHSMEMAIEKTGQHGSGSIAVCNSNHYGAAGYYPLMATRKDYIGMSMTNTTKGVAPFSGKEKMLGTNPLAVAFPSLNEPEVVIDFASSTVAYGKVEIAHREGRSIPENWCLDEKGEATTAPEKMINGGALLPLGSTKSGSGHKGYCLAAAVDILTAVLSGANWGPFATPFAIHSTIPVMEVGKGIGHFFMAWDIEGFRDIMAFKESMDHWIVTMRNTVPQDGAEKVQIPGDPERNAYAKRVKHGIPVHHLILEELMTMAKLCKIPLP
ncbi:MAG: Ldh family oxidoreductase [Cytophagales bacterium]|uniref:Ldh family oxidoreductase n=1 Tax=Cyclobacterium marinum TaxID=104 RepID=UPI0030D93758|nr:Ldh family oxidoreductase [Cytophagales bacterium]|tara:strand:- start:64665 stop:65753 length:1089 start_codon:yes stop_codon:yes gene_type:complete